MIWIIGEYAERIENADELLEGFLETFTEETAEVQLQLLTAAVKLFLKKPTEGPQQMIQVRSFFLYGSSCPESNFLFDFAYVWIGSDIV